MPAPLIPLLAAGLPALGGVVDSLINRRTSIDNTRMTNEANRRAAELAWQREKEMWNMQNFYNSPAEQMRRAKEAGLNPHTVFGAFSPGNATSMPKYQPPHYQYQYAAPRYGQAIASTLPMLMEVGSWMQQMRLSEQEIKNKGLDQIKLQEIIDQMQKVNPQLFAQASNKTFMQSYQTDAMRLQNAKVAQLIQDMRQDYRHKYGEELFNELPSSDFYRSGTPQQSGVRKLQYLQEVSKTKLAEAKASYTDMNITDPQALMQLVLGAVMGLAGTQLRLSTHKSGKTMQGKERPRGLRRLEKQHPDYKGAGPYSKYSGSMRGTVHDSYYNYKWHGD